MQVKTPKYHKNSYKPIPLSEVLGDKMAATPKGPQKVRIDYNIDKPTYDDFVRMCSKKGFTPNIIVERLMKKYTDQGGQI